jgi:hypothetical protein
MRRSGSFSPLPALRSQTSHIASMVESPFGRRENLRTRSSLMIAIYSSRSPTPELRLVHSNSLTLNAANWLIRSSSDTCSKQTILQGGSLEARYISSLSCIDIPGRSGRCIIAGGFFYAFTSTRLIQCLLQMEGPRKDNLGW